MSGLFERRRQERRVKRIIDDMRLLAPEPTVLGVGDEGHIDDEPDLYRVGKKAAGRLLDGVEHNGLPEVRG